MLTDAKLWSFSSVVESWYIGENGRSDEPYKSDTEPYLSTPCNSGNETPVLSLITTVIASLGCAESYTHL